MLGDVLAGVVHVTEVSGTGVAVAAVLVGLAACVVGQQVTLSGSSTFPYVAGGRSVRVNTALNFQKFGCTTFSTAFGGVLVVAFGIHTGVCRTGGVIVTIFGVIAAPIDGRVVAYVVRRTLVFSTRIVVVAVRLRKAAVELLRVGAITCGQVADLQSTGIFIIRAVRILLTATRRQKVNTGLSTHVAGVRCTDISIVARGVCLGTVIGVIREDTAVGRRFTDVHRRRIVVVAFQIVIAAFALTRRIDNRDPWVTRLGIGVTGVGGTQVVVTTVDIKHAAIGDDVGTESALTSNTAVKVTRIIVIALAVAHAAQGVDVRGQTRIDGRVADFNRT